MEEIYQLLTAGNEAEACKRLIAFIKVQFGLTLRSLEFQQSAVSLNSFKGVFETEEGVTYFFKTHIEQGGQIREYAGARLLEEAGYPMIVPVFSCEDQGRELLVYPFIEDVSVFDLVDGVNRGKALVELNALRAAQESFDRSLLDIYLQTFQKEVLAEPPAIQQLFSFRLNGKRFEDFYRGKSRDLGEKSCTFEQLERSEWVVNGRSCGRLGEWLERARRLLSAEAALPFTIVGHGDAHNGNVFYGKDGLRLFDPAYAGRHDPFLDLTKPLFHNVFARWMYFPQDVEKTASVMMTVEKDVVTIDHNVILAPIEQLFLDSKLTHVLRPLIEGLRERGELPDDWQDRLRSSFLCCPLLTVNLFDEKKYSPAMSALGFARVAEMATFDFNV